MRLTLALKKTKPTRTVLLLPSTKAISRTRPTTATTIRAISRFDRGSDACPDALCRGGRFPSAMHHLSPVPASVPCVLSTVSPGLVGDGDRGRPDWLDRPDLLR